MFFSQEKADYYIKRAVENIETVPDKQRLYIRAQSIQDYSSRIPVYQEIINKYPNEKQAYFEIGDMYFIMDQQLSQYLILKKAWN